MATPLSNDRDTRPWYKEPWPWILMAGPAIAMVGCIITIALAIQNDDVTISDGGVKRGLVVSKPQSVTTQSAVLVEQQPKASSN